MNDFLKRRICIGDWIAYPHRYGSSLSMQIGYITDASDEGVKVRKVERPWRADGLRLCREAVLQRPDRAVILSKDTLPAEYLAVLTVDLKTGI